MQEIKSKMFTIMLSFRKKMYFIVIDKAKLAHMDQNNR